jgi:hypothetical protein
MAGHNRPGWGLWRNGEMTDANLHDRLRRPGSLIAPRHNPADVISKTLLQLARSKSKTANL